MPYEFGVRDDGILSLVFLGDQDVEDLRAFRVEFDPHLAAASTAKPLLVLVDGTQSPRFTAGARKSFLELNRDARIGAAAIWGVDRYTRVLADFVLRATSRKNIAFFDTEQQAIDWLKAQM